MVRIKIKISKVFIPFSINRNLVQSWAEVTFKQGSSWLPAILGNNDVMLLAQMLSLKTWVLKLIPNYALHQLIAKISFIKELPSKQLLQNFGNKSYTALENVSIGQWAYTEFYALKFFTDRNPEFLNKFLACVYVNGFFQESSINHFVDFNKTLQNEKMLIYLIYQNERKAFIANFPKVFPIITPSETEPAPQENQEIDFMHAFKLLNEVVNSRIYGTYEQTFNTKLSTILFNKNIESI